MNPNTPAIAGAVFAFGLATLLALIAPTWAASLVASCAIWGSTVLALTRMRLAHQASQNKAERDAAETVALREHNVGKAASVAERTPNEQG